jgi:hypothetical protein
MLAHMTRSHMWHLSCISRVCTRPPSAGWAVGYGDYDVFLENDKE